MYIYLNSLNTSNFLKYIFLSLFIILFDKIIFKIYKNEFRQSIRKEAAHESG